MKCFNPQDVLITHYKWIKYQSHTEFLVHTRQEEIDYCKTQIQFLAKEESNSCAPIWEQVKKDTKKRDPSNPHNIVMALEGVHKYIRCMEFYKNKWVELKFHYPMI